MATCKAHVPDAIYGMHVHDEIECQCIALLQAKKVYIVVCALIPQAHSVSAPLTLLAFGNQIARSHFAWECVTLPPRQRQFYNFLVINNLVSLHRVVPKTLPWLRQEPPLGARAMLEIECEHGS